MILWNVDILHAVLLWTINGIEFSMVILFLVFAAGGKLVQVLNFYFLLFSALLSHRFMKFVLIVFLRNVCYALLKNKLD